MNALHHALDAARRAGMAAVLMAGITLAGCASLPPPIAREVSQAITEVGETRLARVAAASTPEAAAREGHSGFRLLPDGDHAWDARLALIEQAERSLDVQYYSIAGDASGQAFIRALRQAAQRGVRVRLLVDDLFVQDAAPLLAELARHAEVRLFNPLPVREGPFGLRLALSAHEFSRINRRMHNKLLVADNRIAISGGRNIADEYFLGKADAHFVDLDVLSMGPVVEQMSKLFDRFWNSAAVRGWAELERPAPALALDAEPQAATPARELPAPAVVLGADSLGQAPLREALAAGRLPLHWAASRLLADAPERADGTDAAHEGAMLQAIGWMTQASDEVLIVSPYFIPGAEGLKRIEQARGSGIQVRLLTNSASATDEPLAYWRWAGYRERVAELGVEVHELSPQLAAKRRGHSGASISSAARLHSKWAVVDRQQVLIGSMNMDNRSARLNTELGLIIDSPQLAQELMHGSPGDVLADAWRVRRTPGGLEWVAPATASSPTAEPGLSFTRRLMLMLMSALVPEELL